MKKISAIVLSGLTLGLSMSAAQALELWDPPLRAVNEGIPAGALPPPGVYGLFDSYYGNYRWHDSTGHTTNTKVDVAIEIPILLWSTGVKVLGADYAVAQPFD